jgi:hypothetical protein
MLFCFELKELETTAITDKTNPKEFNEKSLKPELNESKYPLNKSSSVQYSNSRSNSMVQPNTSNKKNLAINIGNLKDNDTDEIPQSTRLLNSARAKSAAKQKQQASNSGIVSTDIFALKMESNLTRVVSPSLKSISNRVQAKETALNTSVNGIGDFLLMDVLSKEIQTEREKNKSRPSSSQSMANKLSFKCKFLDFE